MGITCSIHRVLGKEGRTVPINFHQVPSAPKWPNSGEQVEVLGRVPHSFHSGACFQYPFPPSTELFFFGFSHFSTKLVTEVGFEAHEFSAMRTHQPYALWERLVLIVSTKSSAVLTVNFFGLWEFRRKNVSVLKVLGTTQK